jgi:hypothetical protein
MAVVPRRGGRAPAGPPRPRPGHSAGQSDSVEKLSIAGNATGSETNQTSAADYTVKFTLAPNRVLDPMIEALLLRLEPEAQAP